MRILGALSAGWKDLFRARLPDTGDLVDRQVQEQALLQDLRQHAGFAVLLDHLDAEARVLVAAFYDETDPRRAEDLLAEGRAYNRMMKRIEGAILAKQRGQQAEAFRQTQLMKVDAERRRQILERLDHTRQTGPNGRQ